MKKQTLLAFAKKYYEFVYKTSPVFATFLGIHKYDCLIGDMSRRAIERNIKSFRKFKRELGIKKQELRGTSVSNWTDYQLIEADIVANLLLLEKSKDWQKNPNIYVETPLIGIFLLVSRDSITQTQRVKAVTSRLNLYPRMLEQGRTNVKNPPKVYVQIALETLDGAQHFVLTITEELQRLGPVPQKDLERLVSAVKFALTSLSSHKSYLTGLIKKGGGNFALGRRLFEQKLRHENFLDYDADQLLALGEKEFSRIEKKLGEVAQKLAPGKTWPQLVEEYRKFVPDPKNLLELYDNEVTRLVKFLKEKDLVTLPKKETCIVEETPSFERPTVPYAAYMPPAVFEKIQKGVFWVTPINENLTSEVRKEQLREHCLLSYMITTLHESYPGHHLQFCVANKSESFIRKHGQSSLLCEGWALYCEQLMAEVGYYHDPRIKVFMLKDELWRAARVIIDVSLHCFGMTIAEATKILVERVKLAPNQAEAEVKRYTMSPTQPMSYLVGKLMILEMREQAKKTWGSKFNLKRFHDSFLSCGTIPQPLIERELFRQ
jgi:hypothetical protein